MDNYSLEELRSILKNNKLFKPLSDEDVNNIYYNAQIINIKKDKHVFEEGSRQSGIYYILSGLIKHYKIGTKGWIQIFQFSKTGDILGYDSLMNFQTTSTSAMAMVEVELIFIPNRTMSGILMKNQELRVCIMQLVCNELKIAQESLLDLARKSLKLRTIDFLLFLKDNFGLDKNNMIDISLDRNDLAHCLGCTMQSIIRILSELRREKIIETQGKKIRLLKMRALKYLNKSGR
jgi:CRP-like cAMP-binding protein